MSTLPVYSIESFFKKNGLPWSTTIEQALLSNGIKCVEHIKLFNSDEFIDLFPKPITKTDKRLATLVHADLLKTGDVDTKRCAIELGINVASITPQLMPSTKTTKGRYKDDGTSRDLRTCLGFTVKIITKEENKRRRLERKRAAEDEIVAVVNDESIGSHVGNSGSNSSAAAAASRAAGGNDNWGEDGEDDDEDILPDPGSEAGRGLVALPPSNWRDGRCSLSKDLKEPATADERLTWDSDIMPEGKRNVNNLEDPDGYYETLGCDKTSSDDEVANQVKRVKKKLRSKLNQYHEDKNRNKSKEEIAVAKEKYSAYYAKYQRFRRAEKEIAIPNEEGHFAKRVAYDKKGESLCEDMVQVSPL